AQRTGRDRGLRKIRPLGGPAPAPRCRSGQCSRPISSAVSASRRARWMPTQACGPTANVRCERAFTRSTSNASGSGKNAGSRLAAPTEDVRAGRTSDKDPLGKFPRKKARCPGYLPRRPRALEAPAERRTRSGSPDRGGRLCLTGGSTTRYRPGGGSLAFSIGHRATDSGACRRPTVSRRWRVGPFWLAALFALAALARPACAVRLDGVRAVAVSADGAYVYAAAEFADAIVVF